MAEVSLEEISMVMDDIKTFFQRATRGEVEKVLNVQRTYDEVLQLCGAREDEMNEVIREMTKRVGSAEEEAEPPEDPSAHQERMRKLEEATEACKENIEQYRNEVNTLEKQRNTIKQDAESVHVQKRKVEELARREIPRTKHELSLYAHVSKIAWHYEHGNRIQGLASDPAKGDAHTFDFDPVNFSKYEIANKLWDLM
eukprot:scaffold622_cov335-Pavlova_lutheri.AAC.14